MNTALTALALLLTLGAGANAGATSAQAPAQTADQRQAVAQLLRQDAKVETRIAHDLVRGSLGPVQDAFLEGSQPGFYTVEAVIRPAYIVGQPEAAAARNHLVLFFADAAPVLHGAVTRLDVIHESVVAQRDAEQQRAIARGLSHGRLDLHQVAALEVAQLDLAREQYQLTRTGHESVLQALNLSHLQDIQDWAIATLNPTL